jgi:hypothetical protein
MPSVLDAPERIDDIEYVETPAILEERPQARRARPGFWRTLAHGIARRLTYIPHERQAPSCSPRRPFETPMDRLAREHPSLSILALALT